MVDEATGASSSMDDIDAVREISRILEKFDKEQRERILRWVNEKLGMAISIAPRPVLETYTAPQPSGFGGRQVDIKSFIAQKNPNSDNQFAATVAYYYQFEAPAEERRQEIGSEILQEACRKAGRERLGDPGKTLRNAHDSGLLDKGSDRGTFKLSTVGENLVAMVLPGSGSAKSVKKQKRKKKKAR